MHTVSQAASSHRKTDHMTKEKATSTGSVVLYVLATIAALTGLVAMLFILSFSDALRSNAFMLSAALGPLADLLFQGLQSVAQTVGVIVLVIMLGIGGLLFVAGKLIARQVSLAARIARLEQLEAEHSGSARTA